MIHRKANVSKGSARNNPNGPPIQKNQEIPRSSSLSGMISQH